MSFAFCGLIVLYNGLYFVSSSEKAVEVVEARYFEKHCSMKKQGYGPFNKILRSFDP